MTELPSLKINPEFEAEYQDYKGFIFEINSILRAYPNTAEIVDMTTRARILSAFLAFYNPENTYSLECLLENLKKLALESRDNDTMVIQTIISTINNSIEKLITSPDPDETQEIPGVSS